MRKSLSALLILVAVLLAPLAAAPLHRCWPRMRPNFRCWLNNHLQGRRLQSAKVEHVVEPYNALGNGTTVNATIQANNWPATQTAVAGGAGPDIVTTPGPSFAMQLALADKLVSLDDFREQFGWDRPVCRRLPRPGHGRRAALQYPHRNRNARALLQQDALRARRVGTAHDVGMS